MTVLLMNNIQIENQSIHHQHREGSAKLQNHISEGAVKEKDAKAQNSTTRNSSSQSEKQLSKENADHIAENLNRFLKSSQTDLRVEIDRKTNTAVFKIIRKSDKKVIKQVPPEELLEIESRIRKMAGSLLNAAV